ncbi:unnamed protein product [Linum tenue]|uniref:Uncharacterized protein n=1 Tax=Linum tenue TaxID=586396 RepID=A0AAV0P6K8_9ROSI|nr:unnamed protein product [Linum tenue]
MASGFSSATNLAAAMALSFFILLAAAHTSSPVPPSSSAPPPLPDDDDVITLKDKKTAYLMPTLVLFVFICLTLACLCILGGGSNGTVLKVQVVLSARAGDTGRVLRDIFANTNRPESITSSKLKETINALLEHQSSFIYGSSTSVEGKSSDGFWPLKGMVREEERKLRIEREYVYNNQLVPKLAPKQDKDYTVVVIMVHAAGDHKLPAVSSSVDVKEALNYLETKLFSRVLGVEVMWAYQDPLRIVELLDSYPDLNCILA